MGVVLVGHWRRLLERASTASCTRLRHTAYEGNVFQDYKLPRSLRLALGVRHASRVTAGTFQQPCTRSPSWAGTCVSARAAASGMACASTPAQGRPPIPPVADGRLVVHGNALDACRRLPRTHSSDPRGSVSRTAVPATGRAVRPQPAARLFRVPPLPLSGSWCDGLIGGWSWRRRCHNHEAEIAESLPARRRASKALALTPPTREDVPANHHSARSVELPLEAQT